MTKLGALRTFSQGKLDRTDEGDLRLAVHVTADGLVRIDFGKPVAWLAFPVDQARQLAAIIIKNADRAGPQ